MSDYSDFYHVIPENDLKPHINSGSGCKCKPIVKKDSRLVVHNSYDGREFFELDNSNIISKRHLGGKMDKLIASEAVYGVFAWLTGRKEPVTFSENHEAGIGAELAEQFCRANELADVRDDLWPKNLTMPKDE